MNHYYKWVPIDESLNKTVVPELLTFGQPDEKSQPHDNLEIHQKPTRNETLAMAPTTASTNDGQIQTILPAALASALVKLLGVYVSWQIVIKIACSWNSEKKPWSWRKVEVIFQENVL